MIKYISIVIALMLILNIYIYFAKFFNIVDIPNNRSAHSVSTLVGGGIVFPFSLFFWYLLNGFQYQHFIIGLLLISLISLIDDVFGLNQLIRLSIQIISISLILFQLNLFIFPFWIVLFIFAVLRD